MVERTSHQQGDPTLRLLHKHLHITDRSFESILQNCRLLPEDIEDIPQDGYVLEVGSGLNQEFAQGIGLVRPGLKVISIDPTLGLQPDRTDIAIGDGLYGRDKVRHSLSYQPDPYGWFITQEQINEYQMAQHERLQHAAAFGGVAALAESLPVATGSISLVVDSYGAGYYSEDQASFKRYIAEIERVLAPSGTASIYPLGRWLPNSDETSSREEKMQAGELLKELVGMEDRLVRDIFIDGSGMGLKVKRKTRKEFGS